MERITEVYNDGEHKGIMVKEAWGDHVLKTLFTDQDEGYLAMRQLKQYEDTGLAPEQIRHTNVLEKILEEIKSLKKEHPYKVPGSPDTYNQYNEAWQDCLDRVDGMIRQTIAKSNTNNIPKKCLDCVYMFSDGKDCYCSKNQKDVDDYVLRGTKPAECPISLEQVGSNNTY